ncbi:hypothetical protein D3C79_1023900 [compost metagenome]
MALMLASCSSVTLRMREGTPLAYMSVTAAAGTPAGNAPPSSRPSRMAETVSP